MRKLHFKSIRLRKTLEIAFLVHVCNASNLFFICVKDPVMDVLARSITTAANTRAGSIKIVLIPIAPDWQ
jgi:hypothetical protein